ncbi:hypothetical protein Taro_001405 [Colocasia esculenta]|uniref:Uncharacterized protein n=1 Tax=Colocasia esculenta TaxID=4460 RepID=A0A843THW6_COLES|nr:hypothetical protein [Colocasia esculenta]
MASGKSLLQSLRRFLKKPWEITGPQSHPEYRSSVPGALEYRHHCPATPPVKPIIPTSNPETVFDIKYYTRDQRRNRPPIRRTVLRKADVEKMMKEKTFALTDFPPVYLTETVVEDQNTNGGGYQYYLNGVGYCKLAKPLGHRSRIEVLKIPNADAPFLLVLPALTAKVLLLPPAPATFAFGHHHLFTSSHSSHLGISILAPPCLLWLWLSVVMDCVSSGSIPPPAPSLCIPWGGGGRRVFAGRVQGPWGSYIVPRTEGALERGGRGDVDKNRMYFTCGRPDHIRWWCPIVRSAVEEKSREKGVNHWGSGDVCISGRREPGRRCQGEELFRGSGLSSSSFHLLLALAQGEQEREEGGSQGQAGGGAGDGGRQLRRRRMPTAAMASVGTLGGLDGGRPCLPRA